MSSLQNISSLNTIDIPLQEARTLNKKYISTSLQALHNLSKTVDLTDSRQITLQVILALYDGKKEIYVSQKEIAIAIYGQIAFDQNPEACIKNAQNRIYSFMNWQEKTGIYLVFCFPGSGNQATKFVLLALDYIFEILQDAQYQKEKSLSKRVAKAAQKFGLQLIKDATPKQKPNRTLQQEIDECASQVEIWIKKQFQYISLLSPSKLQEELKFRQEVLLKSEFKRNIQDKWIAAKKFIIEYLQKKISSPFQNVDNHIKENSGGASIPIPFSNSQNIDNLPKDSLQKFSCEIPENRNENTRISSVESSPKVPPKIKERVPPKIEEKEGGVTLPMHWETPNFINNDKTNELQKSEKSFMPILDKKKSALKMLDFYEKIGVEKFQLSEWIYGKNSKDKKDKKSRKVSIKELRFFLDWILEKNFLERRNFSIYPCSPKGTKIVLLDDLCADELLKIFYFSFYAQETSPGNYQALLAVKNAEENIREQLFSFFDQVDKSATFHRLAGLTNWKPERGPDFPVVKILNKIEKGKITSVEELVVEGILKKEKTLVEKKSLKSIPPEFPSSKRSRRERNWPCYERALAGGPKKENGEADRSIVDLHWCGLCRDMGFSLDDTAQKLRELSEKSKERKDSYALKTAKLAFSKIR